MESCSILQPSETLRSNHLHKITLLLSEPLDNKNSTPPAPPNSIENTANSCIFTQTHVMLDPCRKTRANLRRNVQSHPRFSRNESRDPRKKCKATGQKPLFSALKTSDARFLRALLVHRICTIFHKFAHLLFGRIKAGSDSPSAPFCIRIPFFSRKRLGASPETQYDTSSTNTLRSTEILDERNPWHQPGSP